MNSKQKVLLFVSSVQSLVSWGFLRGPGVAGLGPGCHESVFWVLLRSFHRAEEEGALICLTAKLLVTWSLLQIYCTNVSLLAYITKLLSFKVPLDCWLNYLPIKFHVRNSESWVTCWSYKLCILSDRILPLSPVFVFVSVI